MKENEKEVMSILQEECAEVIQAVSKIQRFGFDSRWPTNSDLDNRGRLEEELGDMMAMIHLLISQGVIKEESLEKYAKAKLDKLHKWSNIFR
jgi:NTP pyrophosphatase (non-canonical NTP hydrolase)